MKIGAIYVRKSVHTGKGDSIQSQIELCKAYAKKKNILIDDSLIYCDEGYSGKDFNRPGFKRMLGELKQDKFNVLICYRLDRISRSLNDFSNLNEILEKYQTSFISIKELFDTNTPIGKSMMYIASVFAQLERETIAERLIDNLSRLSRTGRWLGGVAPLGFKSEISTYFDDGHSKRKVYKLVPIKSELSKVIFLFDKFLDLKSLSSLSNYCIDANLKSKNNLYFSKTTLKQILTNPVYCVGDNELYDYLNANDFSISNKRDEFNGLNGTLLYKINGEKIISLAKHSGVIKSKEWIKVQTLISNNGKKPYRQGTSLVGLLSGLIICNHCGSLMRVKHGRKNINGVSYYYVCTLKEKDKNKCNISNLNGIHTDMMLCKQVQSLYIKKSFLYFISEYFNLDILSFKQIKRYNTMSPAFDFSDELDLLYDNLDILRYQLQINKKSSSHKYIIDQIVSIERRIDLISKSKSDYINFSKNPELSFLENQFYNQILVNLDILSLSFKDKKYLLNEIFDYIVWDNVKLKAHIK